jgi:hypothetical protein
MSTPDLRKLATAIAAIVAVVVAHSALQFWLYRERVVSRSSIAQADWIVFGLPNLLAMLAFAVIFWALVRREKWAVTWKFALVIALTITAIFISAFISLFISINTYGT